MEVDDSISYHDAATAEIRGAHLARVLVWKPGRRFASVAAAARRNGLRISVWFRSHHKPLMIHGWRRGWF